MIGMAAPVTLSVPADAIAGAVVRGPRIDAAHEPIVMLVHCASFDLVNCAVMPVERISVTAPDG